MEKRDHHPRPASGRPLSKKQYTAMMIGLGFLLLVLVIGFLVARTFLADRLLASSSSSLAANKSNGASFPIGVKTTQPPVPERQNGSLANLPDLAFSRGQTITIGVTDPFGLINPLYITGDSDQDAVSLIFEPLLNLDQEGKPDLLLADELIPDMKNRKLTVRLSQTHIWRDGRLVSTADVVFTYKCLIAPSYDGPLAGRFADIQSIEIGPKSGGSPTVVFTFQPGVTEIDYSLLTIGILKSDYYAIPEDRVCEMGRKALLPEGSGAYQYESTAGGKRTLTCREGFAGDVRTVVEMIVGSDDKYPLLLKGELDIVRHDWNDRIESRAQRLLGYSFFRANRKEMYLLTSPDPLNNGLPSDPESIHLLLLAGAGQSVGSLKSVDSLSIQYFAGIEPTEEKSRTAFAALVANNLRAAGQPVTLTALKLPELAENASLGTFQLMLLPVAADNRLPARTVLNGTRPDRTVNATVVSFCPQIILVSARLASLSINPFGAPFAAAPCTVTHRIANVRILNKDGSYLIKE